MDPLINLSAGQNIILDCSIGFYNFQQMQLVNCLILNEAEAEAKVKDKEAKAKDEEAKAQDREKANKDAEAKRKEENAYKVDSYSKAKEFYNLGNYSEAYQYFQYVNSTDEFTDQPKVINGASELISAVFSENGKHTRAAISSNSLPLGAAVEIDAIFELK